MSSVINDLQSAPQTFSSWDSCMAKAYCKWPAIVGIILASLLVLSVVWCIASCLCCGATLCGSCVRCLTCFGCCGMCKTGSGGGGGRKVRHKDDYSQMPPTPYNGYQPAPAMAYNRSAPASQFAQFDASSNKNAKINEDSLPAMPTWANATSRQVEDHSPAPNRYGDDVEMGRMAPAVLATRGGGYNQVPHNAPRSPISPGPHQGYFEGQSQPYQYNSGAQHMYGGDNRYDNFVTEPLSPAPTYTTQPVPLQPVGAAVTADRFASHAPTPQDYSRHEHEQTYAQPQRYAAVRDSHTPYSPASSTRYEVSDYNSYRPHSVSPPPNNRYSYEQSTLQPQTSGVQSTRPPSLLQVGRKAAPGSRREV